MTTLRSLTEKVKKGDELAWIGEQAYADAGERVYPNTVTEITHLNDGVRVDGEGIRGGEYYYILYDSGDSEAYFVNPNKESPQSMGTVVFAHLEGEWPVPVVKGFHQG